MKSKDKLFCDSCDSAFLSKESLKRHIRVHHMHLVYRCNKCSKTYTRKEGLKYHEENVHRLPELYGKDKPLFECALCGKEYRFKNCLAKHISQHENDALLPCSYCRQEFKYNKNRLRHVRKCHFDSSEVLVLKTCDECPTSLTKKSNPNRNGGYASNTEYDHCGKVLRKKTDLSSHLVHNENDKRCFLCSHCGKGFKYSKSLRRHRRSFHLDPNKKLEPNTNNRFKCGPCNRNFFSKKCINAHYEEVHDIKLETVKFVFTSVNEFNQWKSDIQQQTATKFFADTKWKNKDASFTQIYQCHLSAMYTRKNKQVSLRMFRRRIISKKLSEYCPSEIIVRTKPNGMCYVDYLKTHVGHAIGARKELYRVHLNEKEQLDITSSAELKETKPIITRRLESSVTTEKECPPINSSQDVSNVSELHEMDVVDENSFFAEHRNSILFFKDASKNDCKTYPLEDDDFALVYMCKNQEEDLRRYGPNVIAIEETHIQNNSVAELFLHTLLVMDVNRESTPVAFLLTNRNDPYVVEIFLKCVRERVGVIAPKIFMSDMQSAYYNSWVEVMALPDIRINSTWHVNEDWRRQSNKIMNKRKRRDISKQMYVLLHELDPLEFEEKLRLFLSNTDDEVRDFIKYFEENYSHNVDSWAYCYRNHGNVNVNMSLGNFRRQLKNVTMKMTKENELPWLQYSLNFLRKFLLLNEIKKLRMTTGANPPYEVRELRKRHHIARKYFEEHDINEVVTTVDDQSWFVRAFQENEDEDFADIYVVQKIPDTKECTRYEGVDCTLPCQLCDTCFHEFVCNCLDSSINNNMCRHIHAVGIFRRSRVAETPPVVPDTSQLVPNTAQLVHNSSQLTPETSQLVPDNILIDSDTVYVYDDTVLVTVDDGDKTDINQFVSENAMQECVNTLYEIFRIARSDEDLINLKEKTLLPAVADIQAKYAVASSPAEQHKNFAVS